ncbi:MAG: hypothetical protein D3922_09945, partial [Candidatus Electrothrix sp. AR1]|nr:hypothetical protein [Candidatus Electrothrix sp. AR1]
KEKLISAIDNEKINFSIKQGYRDFPQNVLIYYCRDYGLRTRAGQGWRLLFCFRTVCTVYEYFPSKMCFTDQ